MGRRGGGGSDSSRDGLRIGPKGYARFWVKGYYRGKYLQERG